MVDVPQGGQQDQICMQEGPFWKPHGERQAGTPVRRLWRQSRYAVICARLTEWLWPWGSFQNNQAADARPWQRWWSEGGGGVCPRLRQWGGRTELAHRTVSREFTSLGCTVGMPGASLSPPRAPQEHAWHFPSPSPFISVVATTPLPSHTPRLGPWHSPDAGIVRTGLSSLWGCQCVKPGRAPGAAAAPRCSCGTWPSWAACPDSALRRTSSAPGQRRCLRCFPCSCQKRRRRAGWGPH